MVFALKGLSLPIALIGHRRHCYWSINKRSLYTHLDAIILCQLINILFQLFDYHMVLQFLNYCFLVYIIL